MIITCSIIASDVVVDVVVVDVVIEVVYVGIKVGVGRGAGVGGGGNEISARCWSIGSEIARVTVASSLGKRRPMGGEGE
jgi:hypothetical protein